MGRLAAVLVLAFALLAPAAARADVLDEYQALVERELTPAPLVPTTVPAALGRIERAIESHGSRRRSGYGLRFTNSTPAGADAIVVLEGGSFKGMRGAVRAFRRAGFSTGRTRVRGHAGRLLARSGQRGLLWREGGVVYWVATGTLDTVSVRGLRRMAAGLDRLGGAFAGTGDGDRYDTGAVIVTTATTVSVHVDWGAECFAADGSARAGRAGSKRFTLLPLAGAAFTADLAGRGWAGTLSGAVREGAVDVEVRAARSADGATCDTGPVAFTARPIEPF